MLQSIERQSPTAGDGAIGAWHGSGVVVLGFRNLTRYRIAHCSAASHSTPGQHVVDQRCRVDDQVDGVGQPLPGPAVPAEVGFALIPRDDLQVDRTGRSRGRGPVSELNAVGLGPINRDWKTPRQLNNPWVLPKEVRKFV